MASVMVSGVGMLVCAEAMQGGAVVEPLPPGVRTVGSHYASCVQDTHVQPTCLQDPVVNLQSEIPHLNAKNWLVSSSRYVMYITHCVDIVSAGLSDYEYCKSSYPLSVLYFTGTTPVD